MVPWVPSVDARITDILPHQLRVLEELAQVSERLKKLNEFINGSSAIFASLPDVGQPRLREQATYTADYQDMLMRRVVAFS